MFTFEEIKDDLFAIGPLKGSREDDMLAFFNEQHWEIVKQGIYHFATEVWNSTEL